MIILLLIGLPQRIYDNMHGKNLCESSERGKTLFQFDVKPRNDHVDRWHIPKDFQSRYDRSK